MLDQAARARKAEGVSNATVNRLLETARAILRCAAREWNWLDAALKRAGIENFRWHDLRHTWASWHVQSGTPLQVLQELGGWSSCEMVLRYAHLSAAHLADYAERLYRPKAVDRTLSGTSGKDAMLGSS